METTERTLTWAETDAALSLTDEHRAALVAFAGDMAFDYAEAGWCREGKELAEWALDLDPRDASAAHALAHALAEGGEHAATAAFVERWLDGCAAGSPDYSHLSWHLAMSKVRLGHPGEALRVYRERLDPANLPATRLRDAAGLLWRLELEAQLHGAHVALPWGAVRDLAAGVIREAPCGMDAVHAATAFAAAGDTAAAARLVKTLRRQGQAGDTTAETVALPFVRGIWAFGEQRYGEAERLLAPVAGELPRLGASNGQAANVLLTLDVARRHRLPRWPVVERCESRRPGRTGNGALARPTARTALLPGARYAPSR